MEQQDETIFESDKKNKRSIACKRNKNTQKITFAWVLNNLTSEYDTFIIIIIQSIRVNDANSIKIKTF